MKAIIFAFALVLAGCEAGRIPPESVKALTASCEKMGGRPYLVTGIAGDRFECINKD